MSEQNNTPPSSSLILRILGGIYLVYLAWDMRSAIPNGHSIWTLARHGYFRKTPETDSTEEMEDESDE